MKTRVVKASIVITLALGLGYLCLPKNSSSSEVFATLRQGEELRKSIERFATAHGSYPESLKDVSDLPLPKRKFNYKYSEHGSNSGSYYISFELRGRRESLTYFKGPLYTQQGWYHRGYGIGGFKGLRSHAISDIDK